MTDWHDRAAELARLGNKHMAAARVINAEFFPDEEPETTYERVHSYLRRWEARQEREQVKTFAPEAQAGNEQTLIKILKTGADLNKIADQMRISKRIVLAEIEDLIEQGVCIDEQDGVYRLSNIPHNDPITVDRDWNGDQIIRFGLLGDTQINSKYTQLTHLHSAYDFYKREGITDVYHLGDIDEGDQMRMGHQYECYNQGADDHIDEIVRVYPKVSGIRTQFITGNHDHSIIKRAGHDIGPKIALLRPDMTYLGQSQAFIKLTPECTLELRHPEDGTAYAISYKIQKMVEAMSGGEKPHILAVGHYHKAEYIPYRNIHCIQTACLQAQTPWMRGKGISAALGFYLVEIHVNEDGQINRFKPEFMPFYKAIKDDYLNFR